MPWQTEGSSPRRLELPADWPKIRVDVLDRDGYRCRWPRSDRRAGVCGAPANQVDHKEDRDSYALDDLWSLCQYHHMHKTGLQAAEARQESLAKLRHPVEKPPGLL